MRQPPPLFCRQGHTASRRFYGSTLRRLSGASIGAGRGGAPAGSVGPWPRRVLWWGLVVLVWLTHSDMKGWQGPAGEGQAGWRGVGVRVEGGGEDGYSHSWSSGSTGLFPFPRKNIHFFPPVFLPSLPHYPSLSVFLAHFLFCCRQFFCFCFTFPCFSRYTLPFPSYL